MAFVAMVEILLSADSTYPTLVTVIRALWDEQRVGGEMGRQRSKQNIASPYSNRHQKICKCRNSIHPSAHHIFGNLAAPVVARRTSSTPPQSQRSGPPRASSLGLVLCHFSPPGKKGWLMRSMQQHAVPAVRSGTNLVVAKTAREHFSTAWHYFATFSLVVRTTGA